MIKETVIQAQMDDEILFNIANYLCKHPEKAHRFAQICPQGFGEGLSEDEMLLLFVGGELVNGRNQKKERR